MQPKSSMGKKTIRDIMYAGGLNEEYGLGYLCEAFNTLKDENIRLVFYGDGPYRSKIEEFAASDSRIIYKGIASNDVIVEAERESTLLVDPRFTGAEYTLYSFPSKNIEYMVSGTPLITTRLAGIPDDYYLYVFTFDEETVEGYASKLKQILSYTDDELRNFGYLAQRYILESKNAVIQVKKIIKLMVIIIKYRKFPINNTIK